MKRTAKACAVAAIATVVLMGLASAQTPQPTKRAPPAQQAGQALFIAKCGYCHLEGGTGTMMLERRLGKRNAMLGQRSDLQADYVTAVARNGLNSMPTITRVEVSDEDLARIAAFIASRKKGGAN